MIVSQINTANRAMRAHGLSLNLAIGPSCFVQCRGCYNGFGRTAVRGGLVTRSEIAAFVESAVGLGVRQVTVSGGDPLTHPDIIGILYDLRRQGLYVKLDTVGTALLRDAKEIFYGSETVQRIDPEAIVDYVDMIGFPLDGISRRTQALFRRTKGPKHRPSLGQTDPLWQLDGLGAVPSVHDDGSSVGDAEVVRDTPQLIKLFRGAPLLVCVNTVVHALNVHELRSMALMLSALRPDIWQLFEFIPSGPLGGYNRSRFELRSPDYREVVPLHDTQIDTPPSLFELPHEDPFIRVTDALSSVMDPSVEMHRKSRRDRDGIYFLVNDAGVAWQPGQDSVRPQILGHIEKDRELVLDALRSHLDAEAVQ